MGFFTSRRAYSTMTRFVQRALDLGDEDVPGPAVRDCLPRVPLSMARLFHPVEQHAHVKPRQSCSNLLHKWFVAPRGREGAHVLEVAGREALHLGERGAQVSAEP